MASSQEINIPQKPPMVMVDRLLRHEGAETVTTLLVREENVFVENGLFTEPGLIENMAQTAAAGTGAAGGGEGGTAPVGFIGGIKNLVIRKLPRVGDTIETTVRVEHSLFDATVIRGEVRLAGVTVAECEMKIFLIRT